MKTLFYGMLFIVGVCSNAFALTTLVEDFNGPSLVSPGLTVQNSITGTFDGAGHYTVNATAYNIYLRRNNIGTGNLEVSARLSSLNFGSFLSGNLNYLYYVINDGATPTTQYLRVNLYNTTNGAIVLQLNNSGTAVNTWNLGVVTSYAFKLLWNDTTKTYYYYHSINDGPMLYIATTVMSRASASARYEFYQFAKGGTPPQPLSVTHDYHYVNTWDGTLTDPFAGAYIPAVHATAPLVIDGNASDWDALPDFSQFQSANVKYTADRKTFEPNDPNYSYYGATYPCDMSQNIRYAWDANYLYILAKQKTATLPYNPTNLPEAPDLDTYRAALWNYDSVSFKFDWDKSMTDSMYADCQVHFAYKSDGAAGYYTYNRNGNNYATCEPSTIANTLVATSGTNDANNRVIEAAIKWSDIAGSVSPARQPGGDLLNAIKVGYTFGCDPLIWDHGWFGSAYLSGAYHYSPPAQGGSPYAVRIKLVECALSDVDNNCQIDFADFATLSQQWLVSGCTDDNNHCNGSDITNNGNVGLSDVVALAADWLKVF